MREHKSILTKIKIATSSRFRKYGKAIEVLRFLVDAGVDRAPDSSLLTPAAAKQLRSSFADIPGRTWSKAVSDARSDAGLMPTMKPSLLTSTPRLYFPY